MRLFIAIDLPDEVKSELARVAESLGRQAESARIVPGENFHVTLLFIGETKRVDEAKELMREVYVAQCAEALSLTLSGIGSFNQRKGRGHTWWVGVEAPPELHRLATALADAFKREGFDVERRAYRPHLTLARSVHTSKQVALDVPVLEVLVNHISLMRSVRENDRMRYTEIARV
jgi:2'-5' RNA ligase